MKTTTDACSPTSAHAMDDAAATAVARTLKALADPLRVRMLSAITADPRGEVCVCDLETLAAVSQPTVSHHLRVLRDAGVVESERRGTWVYYRITPGVRPAVIALLASFAPAAVTVVDAATASGLDDVDAQLTRVAEDLGVLHPTLDTQLVLHVVRESYAGLTRATSAETAVPLAARFARQRLADLSGDADRAPHVLFLCVANAGRSQLAAALTTERSGGRVIARSAGSAPARAVHPHVRSLLTVIDPAGAADMFPKPLTDDAVRAADVVITMGCGDVCPVIPGVRYEDWAVGDPALASPEGVEAIRDDIAARVDRLLTTL